MAIQVSGTTVISNNAVLQNVTGLKTVNNNSLLGSGNITISGSDVKTNAYTHQRFNQYGVAHHSPGFSVGRYIAAGSGPGAGSFNNGAFSTGINTSGYQHFVMAVRTG